MLQVPAVRKTADKNVRTGKYLRLLKHFFLLLTLLTNGGVPFDQKTEPKI
jgi:hypothetical protein